MYQENWQLQNGDSPSTRQELIRHRGQCPRPWCSALRWGRWRCPPGWKWSWMLRPPCRRNKMFYKQEWLTAKNIYHLGQREFKCSRRMNPSLVLYRHKMREVLSNTPTLNLLKICVRPEEVWDQRLGPVRQEMSKFFKVWPKMRLGNVPGMFTEHFPFHQPEQEGEAPLQAAATTGCGTDIAGLMGKEFYRCITIHVQSINIGVR